MNWTVVAETSRRHATNILLVSLAALICVIAFAIGRTENPGALWTSFLGLFVIAVGAELIGPEFSSGTLQLILVKPVNRAVYLVSRWTGVMLTIFATTWLAFSVEAISRVLDGSTKLIGKSAIMALNASTRAMLVCALLALFGTFLRAYFNVAFYFVLQMAIAAMLTLMDLMQRADRGFFAWLGDVFRRNPIVRKSLVWIDWNLFPEAPQRFERTWMLLVLTNAAIALVVACFIFRRREVPYGAD